MKFFPWISRKTSFATQGQIRAMLSAGGKGVFALALVLTLACATEAQSAPAAAPSAGTHAPATDQEKKADPPAEAPAPTALPTPTITGPLQGAAPINFEVGPLGKWSLDGIFSGWGLFQNNAVAGNNGAEGAVSNAQLWLQKTTGWFQFYVQAGAYDIVALGTPFLSTQNNISDLYGPVPVGYVKLVPGKNTNIEIGSLPTLVGAEYTFDFQNMNIERGLLWNQENAITQGVQINQTLGKFTASFSWNDGYYSNRFSGLSGSLTYTNGPHSVAFIGAGYLGQTNWQTLATPVQNNGQIYNLMYTYTKGPWILQPYIQYNRVPTNPSIGVANGAQAWGGAILASRVLKKGFSLAGRWEYIGATGRNINESVNLLYGPGSSAWSLTATPTYQYKKMFTRADISYVGTSGYTPGFAFGSSGTKGSQTRGVVELGFLF